MAKIKVGTYEPEEVSPLVNELYLEGREIMEKKFISQIIVGI